MRERCLSEDFRAQVYLKSILGLTPTNPRIGITLGLVPERHIKYFQWLTQCFQRIPEFPYENKRPAQNNFFLRRAGLRGQDKKRLLSEEVFFFAGFLGIHF